MTQSPPLHVMLGYEAALAGEGGIPRYVRRLAQELGRSPEVAALSHITGRRIASEPPPAAPRGSLAAAPRAQLQARVIGAAMRGAWTAEGYFRLRSAIAARRLSALPFDVLHEPNYVVRSAVGPTVVSIHDMSVFDMPEMHPSSRVRALAREIPRSLRVAHRVVTLSEFSRRAIASRFPWASDKIDVIPIGLSEVFRPMDQAEAAPALAALNLSWKGYLLFVGAFEPRKNIAGLLTALRSLRDDGRWRWPLAVVGGGGWRNEMLTHDLKAADAAGAVRLLGQVDDAALASLYAGAKGVAFPSFYEGQGLPALEAAASGAPVLTSRGTPMAEYLGEDAVLVDPHDIRSIAQGLERIAESGTLQTSALAAAPRIAAAFGWPACLAATLNSYRRAIDIARLDAEGSRR